MGAGVGVLTLGRFTDSTAGCVVGSVSGAVCCCEGGLTVGAVCSIGVVGSCGVVALGADCSMCGVALGELTPVTGGCSLCGPSAVVAGDGGSCGVAMGVAVGVVTGAWGARGAASTGTEVC
jgi:hypothetical protein